MGTFIRANPLFSLLSASVVTIALLIGWNNMYPARTFSRTFAVGAEPSEKVACIIPGENEAQENIYFVNCGGFF